MATRSRKSVNAERREEDKALSGTPPPHFGEGDVKDHRGPSGPPAMNRAWRMPRVRGHG